LITFQNDDENFKSWVAFHTNDGYVLNCVVGSKRSSGPYLLHRADCVKFRVKGKFGENFTTTKYYKVCSRKKEELVGMVKRQWSREIPCCKLCAGA
jgi:hypothetical protein